MLDNGVMTAMISGVVVVSTAAAAYWTQNAQSKSRMAEVEQLAKIRRAEKEEDYKRQDAVAAQAKRDAEIARQQVANVAQMAAQTAEDARQATLVVAQEAAESRASIDKKLHETTTLVQKTAAISDEKLNVIHTLVNSTLTTALKNELDALIGRRATMQENLELKVAAGFGADNSAQKLLSEIEEKIEVLKVVLHDRDVQTTIAAAELLKEKLGGPKHEMTPPPDAPPTLSEVTQVTEQIADVQAQTPATPPPTTVSSA